MTKGFLGPKAMALVRDELEVQWRIRGDAAAKLQTDAVSWMDDSLMADYASRAARLIAEQSPYGLSLDAIEISIRQHSAGQRVGRRLRAAALVAAGDAYCDIGQVASARRVYRQALTTNAGLKTAIKYGFSLFGAAGTRARAAFVGAHGRGSRGTPIASSSVKH
jgi:hypothetical protein